MRTLKRDCTTSSLLAAIGVGGLLLAGCGGGGSSSSPALGTNSSGNQPASNTQPGQDLDTVIGNTSQGLPTQAAITNVQGEYALALAATPNDAPTNAGYAISTAALAGISIQSATGLQLTSNALVNSNTSSTNKVASMLCIWNLPANLRSGNTPKLTPLDILPNIAPATMLGHSLGSDQNTLAAADTLLQGVERSINFILNNTAPTFTFVVTNPSPGAGTGNTTAELGKPEFEALEAAVATARAVINASIAYSVDEGTFTYGPVSTQFTSVYTAGGTLTPGQYLPPSPFATLKSSGSKDIKTVQTELLAAANAAELAITGIETRNNSGFLLNPGTIVTNAQLNTYLADIQKYAPYLTQTATVSNYNTGGGATTTVDLAAFFNNPPKDLKTLAPNITVAAPDQFGNVLWTAPAANYPGLVNGYPTFGGIFPQGDSLLAVAAKDNGFGAPYYSSTGDQTNSLTVIEGTLNLP